MAHFANLDEHNTVVGVVVVDNADIMNLPFPESEPVGVAFLTTWSGGHTRWKQTSYNGTFRFNYAGVGFNYDPQRDAFIPPKPYESWVLDEDTCLWIPPVPYPTDGQMYLWDENLQAWANYTGA